jgi:hypothetical protein
MKKNAIETARETGTKMAEYLNAHPEDAQRPALTPLGVAMFGLEVGDVIRAGYDEDEDVGTVTAIDGDMVTVAWHNGTRTTQHIDALDLRDEND